MGANVEWLPYDLHPEYPADGIDRAVLMARYGTGMVDAVRGLADEAGLPYNPHPDRVPNTRAALELTEWARSQGPEAHEDLHERIMDAYWRDGRDIGDRQELMRCVADAGLDPDAAKEALADAAFAEPVDTWTRWAQSHGISAVPAFVFENRLLVSGAVPNTTLEQAAGQVREIMAAEG